MLLYYFLGCIICISICKQYKCNAASFLRQHTLNSIQVDFICKAPSAVDLVSEFHNIHYLLIYISTDIQ